MYTDIHTEFILTPIRTILEQGINASQSLPSGIESYPVSEYYLQSLFLRMTGASEQKMKCILWQMATDDFEYRYKYLNYQGMGECSTYGSKNIVFRDLLSQIAKKDPEYNAYRIWEDYEYDEASINAERTKWEEKVKMSRNILIDKIIQKGVDSGKPMTEDAINKMKKGILSKPYPEQDFLTHLDANKRRSVVSQILDNLILLFENTNLAIWRISEFRNFQDHCERVIKGCEVAEIKSNTVHLLTGKFEQLFVSLVYNHRNRTAHNTISYQQNLPALDTLASKDYYLQNYFFRFAIIIVMDEVFLRLYRKYLDVYAL